MYRFGSLVFGALLCLLSLSDVAFSTSISRARRQTEKGFIEKSDYQCNCAGCTCVPYYQCLDGNIITDGTGLIDIR